MIAFAVHFDQIAFQLLTSGRKRTVQLFDYVAIKQFAPILRGEDQVHYQLCNAMALSEVAAESCAALHTHGLISLYSL